MEQTLINEALKQLKTVRDIVRFAATQFGLANVYFGHGTNNAWDEAVALVFPLLHLSFEQPNSVLNARLTTSEKSRLMEAIVRRIEQRIPVSYLTNKIWFAGLEFYVDQRVIIPRSPIAELIEQHFSPWILSEFVHSILDLCTGSACIAIACAKYFPEAEIDAIDISTDALAVAKINKEKHAVDNLQLIQSDLFAKLEPGKQYDVIVSNPPYVDANDMAGLPAEYRYEPSISLAAGDDGLDCVRRILAEAKNYLTDQGLLIVEVGNSADALIEQFSELPFTWVEFERGEAEVFILRKEDLP